MTGKRPSLQRGSNSGEATRLGRNRQGRQHHQGKRVSRDLVGGPQGFLLIWPACGNMDRVLLAGRTAASCRALSFLGNGRRVGTLRVLPRPVGSLFSSSFAPSTPASSNCTSARSQPLCLDCRLASNATHEHAGERQPPSQPDGPAPGPEGQPIAAKDRQRDCRMGVAAPQAGMGAVSPRDWLGAGLEAAANAGPGAPLAYNPHRCSSRAPCPCHHQP